MKFSIVIPAYNAERTLRRCIESLQEQLFEDFEAIIVDDGSTDCTAQIAREITEGDSRFVLIQQNNQGVSATRNRGIREAKGEFVVFLDSDDQYDASFLQEFSQMIGQYPDYDHFWCGFKTVSLDGEVLRQNVWAADLVLDRAVIMDLHEKTMDAALWNKAFRRDVLIKNDIRMDPQLSLGEDLLFNFAYLDVCNPKIVVSSKPLYLYTKFDDHSLDSKYRENLLDIYLLLSQRMITYLRKWQVSDGQLAKYYSSVFYMLERVLNNTYRPECQWEKARKRKYNRSIIRSELFQTALRQSECYIHPLYRCAYTIGSWNLIMLLELLRKRKNGRNGE